MCILPNLVSSFSHPENIYRARVVSDRHTHKKEQVSKCFQSRKHSDRSKNRHLANSEVN